MRKAPNALPSAGFGGGRRESAQGLPGAWRLQGFQRLPRVAPGGLGWRAGLRMVPKGPLKSFKVPRGPLKAPRGLPRLPLGEPWVSVGLPLGSFGLSLAPLGVPGESPWAPLESLWVPLGSHWFPLGALLASLGPPLGLLRLEGPLGVLCVARVVGRPGLRCMQVEPT